MPAPMRSVRFTETMSGDRFVLRELRLSIDPTVAADGGLHGRVLDGQVRSPALDGGAWRVDPNASTVRLLHRTERHARQMTYDLRLCAPSGTTRVRLLGEKHLGGRPLRTWTDTTTLHLRLYADGAAVADGVARLRSRDFLRQLISMRGRPTAIARFLIAFARGLVASWHLP